MQQYVYGDINELQSLQEANLQIYTPNTRFWWRLKVLECASHFSSACLQSEGITRTWGGCRGHA